MQHEIANLGLPESFIPAVTPLILARGDERLSKR
jgi:hypothetical protein